jgi:hypothetical protein
MEENQSKEQRKRNRERVQWTEQQKEPHMK